MSLLTPVTAGFHRLQKRNGTKYILVMALWTALQGHHPYSAAGSARVGRLAARIGRKLGLSKREVRALLHAGWLQYIGKYFVPLSLLNKPAELDSLERRARSSARTRPSKTPDSPESETVTKRGHHMKYALLMYQRGEWGDCDHIHLPNGGTDVVFAENATTANEEMFTNINWLVPVASWRELLRRFDRESPVSYCGVSLTRLPNRSVRVEWVKTFTFDPRCFPPGRPGRLTVARADLVID
jgi:hypothetical protein